LSLGDTATFCQVCGTPAEPATPASAAEPETGVPSGAVTTGVEDAPEDVLPRRMAEVSGLLQDASACEATDGARAADLYRKAIFACLEATEDPLGSEDVRRDLLRGFDSLSGMLEREGIQAEALDVVDSAASLGLLDSPHDADREHLDALRDRRQSLRHLLHGDSAQL
jgi:hypothetical protein